MGSAHVGTGWRCLGALVEREALFASSHRLFEGCPCLFLTDLPKSSLQHVPHLGKLLMDMVWRWVGLGAEPRAVLTHVRAVEQAAGSGWL